MSCEGEKVEERRRKTRKPEYFPSVLLRLIIFIHTLNVIKVLGYVFEFLLDEFILTKSRKENQFYTQLPISMS
jgi:type I restriction-modification system DNA methylase subunit